MEHKTHYRVLRSTIVLGLASSAYKAIASPKLAQAIEVVQNNNYDFERIGAGILETLYASFDDAFTARVRDEFEFRPGAGNVMVHASREGVCALCGKGDSKDTHDNEDKTRFEFLLTNTAGGSPVWCGSTCIINFGLKVQGAATADEALRILQTDMRRALRQFEINCWRAAHPDHKMIEDHYTTWCGKGPRIRNLKHQHFAQCVLAGVAIDELARDFDEIRVAFRTASRFYAREGHLTGKKQPAWDRVKHALAQIERVERMLQGVPADVRDLDYYLQFEREQGQHNG